jgi:hypothetical protein
LDFQKARRAGVDLPPPKKGKTSEGTRKRAERGREKGQSGEKTKPSAKRSKARREVLKTRAAIGSFQIRSVETCKKSRRSPASDRQSNKFRQGSQLITISH